MGATIDIAYALIRHRDPALPVARGTVVMNPGGPGANVIAGAAGWTELFAGLLGDHDLLLIDPRGTGRSHPLGIPYQVDGERRVVDDTALAGIAYWADVDMATFPPSSAPRCAATRAR